MGHGQTLCPQCWDCDGLGTGTQTAAAEEVTGPGEWVASIPLLTLRLVHGTCQGGGLWHLFLL